MVGTGEGMARDVFGIACSQVAHFRRDKAVGLPMDDQNGNLCLCNFSPGIGFPDVEMSENQSTQNHEGLGQPQWDGHGFCHMEDDLQGVGIGAVCNDAFDIGGKLLLGSHQHRGTAHGDAVEENGSIVAKLVIGPFHPPQQVLPLHQAEGDGAALALAVGALVDQQQIMAHLLAQLASAGKVRHPGAAVAVEADVQGRAVFNVIKAPRKDKSIVGLHGDDLTFPLHQLLIQPLHFRAVGIIGGATGGGPLLPALFGGEEGNAVGIVGTAQEQGSQGNENPDHITAPG